MALLEQIDPVEAVIIGVTFLLSVCACMYIIAVALKRPPLQYEPRRPVPWNAVGVLPVALLFLDTAAAVWGSLTSTGKPPVPKTAELIHNLLLLNLFQPLVFGGLFASIVVAFRATARDIGLPRDGRQFRNDILLGVVAGIAVLGPVHLIQGVLAYLMQFGQDSGHPLVKMVREGGTNITVLVLASVAVVIVAPICEELMFRLLLQGWLEKWEDTRLGWRTPLSVEPPSIDQLLDGGESSLPNHVGIEAQPINDPEPPIRGIANLPHGWFPILITAALFGLAHTGYGPEPVPLFFLGLVLGYLYQRTHRIVPSIITHSLFNLFTVILLWRYAFTAN